MSDQAKRPSGPKSKRGTTAYYRDQYKKYHSSPEAKKARASRNRARRQAEKQGKVKKGDKKEVDHIDGNPMNNKPSNKRVISQSANRKKQ